MGSGVRGEIAFRAANVTEFARIQECTELLAKTIYRSPNRDGARIATISSIYLHSAARQVLLREFSNPE